MGISSLLMKLVVVVAATRGVGPSASQNRITLATYLAANPWDSAKSGPMVVVDPEHTFASSKEAALKAYARMTVAVGGLTAIVPTEMVLIDDSLTKPPNLYDGMPEYLKVMYLLATLSPSQAAKASGDGIGLNDLQGEQAKVFQSIVAPGLDWATYSVGKDGIHDQLVDQGSVPQDQLDQIKIKYESGLVIYLPLQSNPASYSQFTPLWGNGRSPAAKPGEKWTARAGNIQNNNFGADPRKTVPNVAKASQLNYRESRFDVQISLPAQSTIKELLEEVGDAAHVEIFSDIRVSGLSVQTSGSKARAGDLLAALAMCVTGTYRKVDSAYVLTSDLVGIGARALKFAAWERSIQKELFRRQLTWEAQIAKSGTIDKIGFDQNDRFATDDKTGKILYTGASLPFSELTPTIREYITQLANSGPATNLSTDHAALDSEVRYAFVLPSGQPLSPEYQSLGRRTFFSVPRPERPEPEDKTDMFVAGAAAKHRLLVKAETAEVAIAEIVQARAHGFTQVWLETHEKTVLSAALKQGLRVSLVIRPWEAPPGARRSSKDLNLLGDTGTELAARRAVEPDWLEYRKVADSWEGPPPVYDFASPSDPGLEKRWADLAALAHMPGTQRSRHP